MVWHLPHQVLTSLHRIVRLSHGTAQSIRYALFRAQFRSLNIRRRLIAWQ
jgi:hypothetical protein